MSNVLLIMVALVTLIGLFVIFKPKGEPAKQQNMPAQTISASPSPSSQSNKKTFAIQIENKKIIEGATTISVNQGDEVTIKIAADEPEEFHIHGYDKFTDLEPGKEAELSFIANISGRFPIELEHSKTDIATLEVQPK